MKKLLFLLISVFSTINVFGQTDAQLAYSAVNTVTKVGDTLTVKLQYYEGTDANSTAIEPTLYQFDFQYNNKLLNLISRTWQPASTSAQKAFNSWNGYKFTPDSEKNQNDYDGQYASWLSNDASYSSNSDWSVERVTYQDVTALETGQEFVKYEFIIKDKFNTNYTNYANILNANWANYKKSDGTQIGVTGNATLTDLGSIEGGNAGDVTLSLETNVITNNIADGTDYSYKIYAKGDQTTILAEGSFDASGQAVVSGLENDVEYDAYISISDLPEYLDNVVTVSDLALVFAEAIGAGSSPNGISTTFDYYLQSILANVVGTSIPQGGDVNFDDSYEILAYLQGVTSNNTTYITKAGDVYNISGRKSTYGDVVNGIATVSPTFKPTDSNKSFTFVHGLAGDVNFSHGFEPTSNNADIPATAQSSMASQQRVAMAVGAKYQDEQANLDLTSELRDGQVIFTIGSNVTDMVGAQFNIKYDTTRLVLDNVVFDTGNTMTNFSNHIQENGKINIGSFDQNFEATVKTGTPYKLIFTPTVNLQNTAGLITFRVNEGVKADGTSIKFIMN
mgnify:CR=1 FL=1